MLFICTECFGTVNTAWVSVPGVFLLRWSEGLLNRNRFCSGKKNQRVPWLACNVCCFLSTDSQYESVPNHSWRYHSFPVNICQVPWPQTSVILKLHFPRVLSQQAQTVAGSFHRSEGTPGGCTWQQLCLPCWWQSCSSWISRSPLSLSIARSTSWR